MSKYLDYMRETPDELYHSKGHKYSYKKWVKGKWRYFYDEHLGGKEKKAYKEASKDYKDKEHNLKVRTDMYEKFKNSQHPNLSKEDHINYNRRLQDNVYTARQEKSDAGMKMVFMREAYNHSFEAKVKKGKKKLKKLLDGFGKEHIVTKNKSIQTTDNAIHKIK